MTTTIRVDDDVRDRLSALALDRGTSMGALLAEATDRLERETFFARAHTQLARLRDADPQAWARDRAESRSWQEGTDRDTRTTDEEASWWE